MMTPSQNCDPARNAVVDDGVSPPCSEDQRPRLDTGQSDSTVVPSPTLAIGFQQLSASLQVTGQRITGTAHASLDSGDTRCDSLASIARPQATGHSESPFTIGPCPKTRFHRPRMLVCVLQVACTAALVSGIMLCFTILFYVLGVAGALAFAADGPSVVVAIGIASLVLTLADLIRSFTRTGGRMLMSVWSWHQSHLGAEDDAKVLKRAMSDSWRCLMSNLWDSLVDRLALRLVKQDSIERHPCETDSPSVTPRPQLRTMPGHSQCDATAAPSKPSDTAPATTFEAARDSASNILTLCFLFVFFFVPALLVGCFIGYFAAVSVLVFGSVAGTAVLIFLANAFARISRSICIVRQLIEGVPAERRLAIFVASSGFDTKRHIIPTISGNLAICLFVVFVIANMIRRSFESSIPVTAFFALTLFSVFLRFRFTLLSWRRLPAFVRHFQGSAPSTHYFNSTNLRVPIAILVYRALTLGLGLSCAMAIDGFQLINSPESARHMLALLAPFAFSYFLTSLAHDFTFVFSFSSSRLSGLGILASLFLKCAFAGYMTINGIGCTASYSLAHAYLSVNLRDSRSFWTHLKMSTTARSSASLSNHRFLIRAILVTLFILFASAIATVAGWFTDYKIRVPLPRDDPIFPSNATTISGPPRVAMPACYPLAALHGGGKLAPLDIVTLGSSVYMINETEVHDFIWRNPRFNNRTRVVFWNGRKADSDPPPLRGRPRMAEIRWDEIPNLSVVAIRGTQSYEELFQNLGYWLPSVLIQSSSHVGTLAVFWPRVLTSRLVWFLSSTFGLGELAFDRYVDAYVKALLAQNRSVLLTGHSLGGAIGMVVGARHKVPAVAFGAPGLGYTYKAFGIELDVVAEWGTNIVMHGDPIASVDDQAGTVMGIPCTSNLPNHCHGWQSVMPNLMRTCYGYRQPEPWN